MGFKYFSHTADIGIEVEANSLRELTLDSIDAVASYIYNGYKKYNYNRKEKNSNKKYYDVNNIKYENIVVESDSIDLLIIKIINEILYYADIYRSVLLHFHYNYLLPENEDVKITSNLPSLFFSGVSVFYRDFEKNEVNEVKAATLGSLEFRYNKRYFLKFIIDV